MSGKSGLGNFSELRSKFFGTGIGGRATRGGSVALLLRVISVALAYAMFVTLARYLGDTEYGIFGFTFSLATFAAVVAALGQQMLVLRLIPVYEGEANAAMVRGLVRLSGSAVLIGGVVAAVLVFGVSLLWPENQYADAELAAWTGALIVVLAVGQYLAYALRGFGSIVFALAPRDILWRAAVIIAVVLVSVVSPGITAVTALKVCTLTLAGILFLQVALHPTLRSIVFRHGRSTTDSRQWTKDSRGLWAVTVLQALGPNVSVVLLGLAMSFEAVGPFFAAMKTATLMNLPLVAGNIVGAPMISRFYHSGQIGDVQRVSNYLVLFITFPVLVGFVGIWLFGGTILGLFGEGFADASMAMTILAFGNLINALCGPTAFLMNMTGHQSRYVSILFTTQVVSLACLPPAAIYYGLEGAAWVVALSMIWRNLWVWQWARGNIGVDPTVVGVASAVRRKLS